jgi:uncharacterized protein (TIGR02996 family)
VSRRKDDGEVVDRIIEKGECVFYNDWDSGGLGAGAGSERAYRWRGKFAFASADYGNAGPFDSLEEVLKRQDCLLSVTSATDSIWSSLLTAEEIAARLTYYGYDDDEHYPFSVNGESWVYDPETGTFTPAVEGGTTVPHLGPKAFDAAVLAYLRKKPAAAPEILAHLYANYGDCTNPGTFPNRLKRQVRGRVTAKLLVKGQNVYVPAEAVAEVAGRFDLTDPATRLVAADWLDEQGQSELAGLLRRARRFTCGA